MPQMTATPSVTINKDTLEVKKLSGSDDPPYDFPIPGISPSLVAVNPDDYLERLKGLSFESDEDEDVESRTPPRVRREFEAQDWTPRVPGHFPTTIDIKPPLGYHLLKGTERGDVTQSAAARNSEADAPKPVTSHVQVTAPDNGNSSNFGSRNLNSEPVPSLVIAPDNSDRTTTASASAAPRRDSPSESGSEGNLDSESSASDEEPHNGLTILWRERTIKATRTKMYWTMSDSPQDLPHPTIPGAAAGHIHLHRNSLEDCVQVWLLESESTWVDYSSRYLSINEPFIKHPIYTALVLTTRGREKAPSWVTIPYLRQKIEDENA